MLSTTPIEHVPFEFKGKKFFTDGKTFEVLQSFRRHAIDNELVFCPKTGERKYGFAKRRIPLVRGGRVLAQELYIVVSSYSSDSQLLIEAFGEDWYEWE